MPSMQVLVQSGGIGLVSGEIFSGSAFDLRPNKGLVGGVQLKLQKSAPGLIYIGLPNLSGTVNTFLSGGVLSSGGMADAMELTPGDAYFVPKSRLVVSGLETIRVLAPAASSGGVLFYEVL